MWTGAKRIAGNRDEERGFPTYSIELISYFFAPGEVARIWITFPDPQMKKGQQASDWNPFL